MRNLTRNYAENVSAFFCVSFCVVLRISLLAMKLLRDKLNNEGDNQ